MKNHINLKSASTACWIFTLITLLVGLCSCAGGGTTGTDSTKMVGTLETSIGQPISGASITVLSTGNTSVTDHNGRFELNSELDSGGETLLVEIGEKEFRATLRDIPAKAEEIQVKIEVDFEQGLISAVIVDEITTDSPTPFPSANPTPKTKPSQRFSATIKTKAGTFIRGAQLEIENNSELVLTDRNGKASLKAKHVHASQRFILRFDGTGGYFVVKGLPVDKQITVNFTVIASVEKGQIDPTTGEGTTSMDLSVEDVAIEKN